MHESSYHSRRWIVAAGLFALALALGALAVMWSTRGVGSTHGASTSAPDSAIIPTAPAAASAVPETRPLDGKLLPTPSPALTSLGFPPIPAAIDQQPPPIRAELDFTRLFTTTLPPLEYFAAAEQLGGRELGERTVPIVPARVGDRTTFHTLDGPREAELIFMDDLAAYWVESGLVLDRVGLLASAERLRAFYYPLLRRNFGQEWRPGVDGDPRFNVLHVYGSPDAHELGYFTDEDQYPRALFAQSNEREMVYLNMSQLEAGTALYEGTLVHEIQHLIQWNLDPNEATWLNEGLSQMAETMAGLDTVAPGPYLEQPYVRLDGWSEAEPDIFAHYAASYLYLSYFWHQAGEAALRELARHPADGLAAVRAVLAGHLPDRTLEAFTGDWAAALYLAGRPVESRYRLAHTGDLGPLFFANRARRLPFETTAVLDQYAIDAVDLDISGRVVISFAGDTTVPLIDAGPPGGETFWYALPGNSSQARLTAAVDLSGANGASLEFDVWHDLESGYDFAYLSISADGGRTWTMLPPARAAIGPYGPAWSGRSDANGGWRHESIRLDAYAGRPVQLRFDVITDFENVGRGFAVANLAVSQAAGQPVWRGEGFVETGRLLPQHWEVRLIQEGEMPAVVPLVLDAGNRAQLAIDLGAEGGALLIMPLTPFTASPADYWIHVSR